MADADTVDVQQSSAIEQFQGITGSYALFCSSDHNHHGTISHFNRAGATQDAAKSILEACNWNLEMAVNMHVDSIEPVARISTSTSSAATAAASSSQSNGE
jgi:hypothetical protein